MNRLLRLRQLTTTALVLGLVLATGACNDGGPSDSGSAVVNDADGDGHDAETAGGDDCDDDDASVFPGATDTWYDGVDTDCDGGSDYDADGDGFDSDLWGGSDCDDGEAAVHPGADETCDGVDEDCDEVADDGTECGDDDDDGWSENDGDCNDESPVIGPEASDNVGDGIDQNCDGIDGEDIDGDGWASLASGGEDCVESDPEVHPDQWDVPGFIDTNCDVLAGKTDIASADVIVRGTTASSGVGATLASGDFDGDGAADLLVGGRGSSDSEGSLLLYLGPLASSLLATDADGILVGAESKDYLGSSLAALGDLDGDGSEDFATGAYGVEGGAVYIFTTAPGEATTPSDAVATLLGPTGGRNAAQFGSGLATSDLSGDGVVDLAVGAPYAGGPGAVYVFEGPVTGSVDSQDADAILTGTGGDWTYTGLRLDGAADIDGDGYQDILTSAPGAANGAVYIVAGPVSGESSLTDAPAVVSGSPFTAIGWMQRFVPDADDDGLPEVAISTGGSVVVVFGSDLAGKMSIDSLDPAATLDEAGTGKIASDISTADVDGDGVSELLLADSDGYQAFVSPWPLSGEVDLTRDALTFSHASEDGGCDAIAGLGDLNGDGREDFAVGIDNESTWSGSSGAAYVFFGR